MDSPVNRFSGEQMILASAASDDLRHVLRGVIEATAAGGRPRYPPATGHALARAILTRNYARALLELCHLVGAAERIDRRHGYAGVFWAVTPALSASFQARFQAGAAGAPMVAGLAVNGREIFVAHGRESFAISYARMPFLAALLDFMITALGFRAVDHLLAPVVDQVPGAVPQTANALARAIYGYLRDHLPPPQENRKRYTLLAFLKQRTGAHFTAADIDDAAVFDFWTGPPGDGGDYRLYSRVVGSFLGLRELLEVGQRRLEMEHAGPWFGERWVPGDLAPAPNAPSLLDLCGPERSARLKFLTKREADLLGPILSATPSDLEAMSLSLARAAVFGPMQARLSQALRRGLGRPACRRLLAQGPAGDYRDFAARLSGVVDRLALSGLAALHILAMVGHPAAVAPILAEVTDPAWLGHLRPPPQGKRAGARLVGDLYRRLATGDCDPGVAALLARARRAHRRLERDGFRADQAADPAVVAAAAAGLAPVDRAVAGGRLYLKRLTRVGDGFTDDALFAADLVRFRRRFATLYLDSA